MSLVAHSWYIGGTGGVILTLTLTLTCDYDCDKDCVYDCDCALNYDCIDGDALFC